jgi:protein Xni
MPQPWLCQVAGGCHGLSLVRRIYEANSAPSSSAKAQGAIQSALASIRRALKDLAPTHALMAFNASGPTWRQALYAPYAEGSKPLPAELQEALPSLYDALFEKGLVYHLAEGANADDSLATIALKAANAGLEVIILSATKDLVSLVSPRIRVRDPFMREWHDDAWCKLKFGVAPPQLLDWLALTGTPEGVPGVPGIGVKTATRLLSRYGSLEGILEASAAMTDKLGEKLRAYKDRALLARKLVALKTDVSLGIDSLAQLRVPASF